MRFFIKPVICLVAWAALTAGMISPAQAQMRAMNSSLAGQLRMFQVRVVLGHISATGPANHQTLTSNYMGTQRRETLSIDLGDGQPTVKFERTAPEERISYQILSGDHVLVQLVPRSTQEQPEVSFVQSEGAQVSLTITRADKSTTYHAPTLWQLLVIEPEVCREHLIPLLQIMRPNWQLAQQVDDVENALCRNEVLVAGNERAIWLACVAALASDHYAERERAEQQLRAAGALVVPFLQTLDRSGLDVEQSFRIKRLVRQIAGEGGEDTPDRVAAWLSDDPRVWFSLMQRTGPDTRRLAVEKLTRLLGAAVDFDAEAPVDDRLRQTRRLRERFADVLDPQPPRGESKPQ